MKIKTHDSPKGLQGHILFDINGRPIFRVYNGKEYADYWIRSPDLKVEIIDDYCQIVKEDTPNPEGLHKLSGKIDVR